MSLEQPQTPEEIAREVERVDENVNGLFQQVSRLRDRLDELEDENEALRETVETQAERIRVLEKNTTSQQSGKFQKHAEIIRFADNQKTAGQPGWYVEAKDIMGVTGVSKNYAYQLMEQMSETYSFATLRKPTSGAGTTSGKTKAVRIEFGEKDVDDLLARVNATGGAE